MPKYLVGMQRNAALAKEIYPGWHVLVFYGKTVPESILSSLNHAGCLLIKGDGSIKNPMLWRFGRHSYDRIIIRDADSRLNLREKAAVDEWIASKKACHIMRDHPHHNVVMNGGMVGFTKEFGVKFQDEIRKWGKASDEYGNDQRFLEEVVWPKSKLDCLQHDTFTRHLFPGSKPFPESKCDRFRFVGEVFEADDTPRAFDWEMRFNEIWK